MISTGFFFVYLVLFIVSVVLLDFLLVEERKRADKWRNKFYENCRKEQK